MGTSAMCVGCFARFSRSTCAAAHCSARAGTGARISAAASWRLRSDWNGGGAVVNSQYLENLADTGGKDSLVSVGYNAADIFFHVDGNALLAGRIERMHSALCNILETIATIQTQAQFRPELTTNTQCILSPQNAVSSCLHPNLGFLQDCTWNSVPVPLVKRLPSDHNSVQHSRDD